MKYKYTQQVRRMTPELKQFIENRAGNSQSYSQQRTTADAIERLCIEFFQSKGSKVELPSSNRTAEDFILDGHLVDVKTVASNKSFHLAEIISYQRYRKRLVNTTGNGVKENLYILSISYRVNNLNAIIVDSIEFDTIFNLNLERLRIDNLGNGQIQLADKDLPLFVNNDFDEFVVALARMYEAFCDKQIEKFTRLKREATVFTESLNAS
jgi:hypothetical protein